LVWTCEKKLSAFSRQLSANAKARIRRRRILSFPRKLESIQLVKIEAIMKTFFAEDRTKWRAWLESNHSQASEIWLVHYKKEAGQPQIEYEAAVEEAICFGWIDGKIRKLDDARYARLFTPRKPTSKWSRANLERAAKMIRQGKMTATGMKVFDPRNQTPAQPTKLPTSLEARFRRQESAWENFTQFRPSYQRLTIGWVASAKQEATQLRRLQQLIAKSAAKQRIKFM
jgi:uncharacterized protein YdeI (YjbR/CyaY-like superfamily)